MNLHSWTQSFWIFFICAHLKNVFATQGEERYSAGILIVDRFLVLPYGGFLLCILVLFFPMYGFIVWPFGLLLFLSFQFTFVVTFVFLHLEPCASINISFL